jgi:hypothetical protein
MSKIVDGEQWQRLLKQRPDLDARLTMAANNPKNIGLIVSVLRELRTLATTEASHGDSDL